MSQPDDPSARSPAPPQAAPGASGPPASSPLPGPPDDDRISFDNLGKESSGRPSEAIDLGALVSNDDRMDAQVWMVQKDNLDHGPFSARELGQQIIAGKISGDDQVLNMDTGVRQRCEVWPDFTKVVEKARARRRAEEEAAALRKVETVEKGVGYLRYVIAGGIVLFLGLGIGSYFLFINATRDSGPENVEDFEDLVATGDIQIKTGGGILANKSGKRGRRGRRRGGGGGGGGTGGLTAEEAMAVAADYGDLSGGMTQLSVGQINSVMNRNQRRFFPCLAGHRGRVSLDFVINGDGSVAGVSVTPANVAGCMSGRMRGIRFPSFNSPRMRASFWFEVGN